MADDLTTLKSSLSDRANSLGSYVKALKADSARSDKGFRDALDVCEGYTRAFVAQLDADWGEAAGRDDKRAALEDNLDSFLTRERWIDQRFARGAQRDVPRALKTIARQEFREHRLEGREPVLTVGPPDSFETHQTSLANFLFTDIYIPLSDELERMRHDGSDLSIFSVPYIEGTRVLWYPIVLGHEIAHIRLDHGTGDRARTALIADLLSVRGVDYAAAIEETVNTATDSALVGRDLRRQTLSWTNELICDLNAVRLFGPAGLSAIAEFLSILEFQPHEATLDTRTHPPLWVRLTLLFKALCRAGWQCEDHQSCPDCEEHRRGHGDAGPESGDGRGLPSFAAVWRTQAEGSVTSLDARATYVANIVTRPDVMRQLIEHVWSWGPPYQADGNIATIEHLRDELLDGVPGSTHVLDASEIWREVSVPDVVNGAWAARRALDDKEADEPLAHSGVLLDCDPKALSPHEKRVKVDSLASKAIDTLELARLLGSSRGIISPNLADAGEPLDPRGPAMGPAVAAANTGTLSRSTIVHLLGQGRTAGRGRRMVVTPLSEDSVQDSAIDLRLGPISSSSAIRQSRPSTL